MLPKISSNGLVVRKDVCLEEGTTGRFDEYTECLVYGQPNYSPVGKELVNNFKTYGFNSFIIVFIIAWFSIRIKKEEERIEIIKNKKQFNEILSDEKIINFLYRVEFEIKDDKEYLPFYKKLKKRRFLEELFCKDKTGLGYFLTIEEKPRGHYEIEFGHGWESHGSSYIWNVTFDNNGMAEFKEGATICEYGG